MSHSFAYHAQGEKFTIWYEYVAKVGNFLNFENVRTYARKKSSEGNRV